MQVCQSVEEIKYFIVIRLEIGFIQLVRVEARGYWWCRVGLTALFATGLIYSFSIYIELMKKTLASHQDCHLLPPITQTRHRHPSTRALPETLKENAKVAHEGASRQRHKGSGEGKGKSKLE